MSEEIAVIESDVAALDSLDPASREVALTGVLEQAHAWLERAKMATDPAREISEFKAFIATVAETTKQLKVSKELQQDAEVMVRRSERALGVAIRDGQARGDIETEVEAKVRAGQVRQHGVAYTELKPKPTDYALKHELRNSQGAIYDVTDNVTDEQFESALTEAREEGNVSRANIVRNVRKVRGDTPAAPKLPGPRKKDLQTIRNIINALEGYASVAESLGDLDAIAKEDAADLHSALKKSLGTLSDLTKKLEDRKNS